MGSLIDRATYFQNHLLTLHSIDWFEKENPRNMNADIFQRIRDVISENDPAIILNELVTEVFFQVNFVCVHLDTMDFSVTGEYKPDFDVSGIQINYRYLKYGKWDL